MGHRARSQSLISKFEFRNFDVCLLSSDFYLLQEVTAQRSDGEDLWQRSVMTVSFGA